MSDADVDQDLKVVDFSRGLTDAQKKRIIPMSSVGSGLIASAQEEFRFSSGTEKGNAAEAATEPEPCTVYEHQDFPGESITLFDLITAIL